VTALPAGKSFDRLNKIRLSVEDCFVGAGFTREIRLFRGGNRRVNGGAPPFQELNEQEPDASGTSMDQCDFARFCGIGRLTKVLSGHSLKKSRSADLERERDVVTICRAALEEGRPLRSLDLKGDDLKRLRGFQFLSAKPLLLVINLDEAQLAGTGDAAAVVDRAAADAGLGPFLTRAGTAAAAVCGKIELEISQLDATDAAAFLADLGLKESGLDRVIRASYDLLGYISFFTVGEDECRAWSIPRGTPAQLAAGEIHSDIARGFIRAEVVHYDALMARGSMAAARDHGEVRLEGKEYVVQDGDIINFRFAT